MLGAHVVVGIHSTREISKNKGLPIMNDDERYFLVSSCRWVDEIYKDAPFVTSCDLVLSQNVDFVVHGDDPIANLEGLDCYSEVKERGMFKTVERTKYISTTGLVGRMLLCRRIDNGGCLENGDHKYLLGSSGEEAGFLSPISSSKSVFDEENLKRTYLKDLLEKFKIPEKKIEGKVAYIDGVFDLFHAGHASILKICKENGWYTVVGLFSQSTSRKLKDTDPIMSILDRKLCVSACKYVDKIISNVPLVPDESFVREHSIDIIVCGANDAFLENYHLVNKVVEMKLIKSEFPELTTNSIVGRIIDNYHGYSKRNEMRNKK